MANEDHKTCSIPKLAIGGIFVPVEKLVGDKEPFNPIVIDKSIKEKLKDVVHVVRCKNCKKWKSNGIPFDITKGVCYNPVFHFHHGRVIDECFMPITNETDFCSYGERREG